MRVSGRCPAAVAGKARHIANVVHKFARYHVSTHNGPAHRQTFRSRRRSNKVVAQAATSTAAAPKPDAENLEFLAPENAQPGPYQQTVNHSFTIGGIGLHTGEYAYIRVRPAFAGDGRYFVRVEPGTNSHLFQYERNLESDAARALPMELQMQQISAFTEFLRAQEEGYTGDFYDFCDATERPGLAAGILPSGLEIVPEFEEPMPRSEDEIVVPANIMSVDDENEHRAFFTSLRQEDEVIHGVEHLLAVLEACGVDNARIEIEGGNEIPVCDGSAQVWFQEVTNVGLRVAAHPESGEPVPKMVLQFNKALTISDSDAFVSFFPDDAFRLTYGIDHLREAPVIGKQWKSFNVFEDEPFGFELAPARTFWPTIQDLYFLRDSKLLKGGTIGCGIVGFGDRWYEPLEVRFPEDEPVRHKLLDLYGDLALMNINGHGGVPAGHVVAYKAHHGLHVEFCKQLMSQLGQDDAAQMVEFEAIWSEMLTRMSRGGPKDDDEEGPDAEKQAEYSMFAQGGAADEQQGDSEENGS